MRVGYGTSAWTPRRAHCSTIFTTGSKSPTTAWSVCYVCSSFDLPIRRSRARPSGDGRFIWRWLWMQGCWEGKVNLRDFREEWLPLRSDIVIGASQTVLEGKTVDFEYLRIESRPEGVFYVASLSGKKETSFRLAGRSEDGPDEIFT